MQRACACALLHKGRTFIANCGSSNDDNAAINIIQQLGATVNCTANNTIVVTHEGDATVADTINCFESGLSARLFTPIAAMYNHAITVTGTGSLLARPMDAYAAVLPELGVVFSAQDNKLPITVTGPLQPKEITIDGGISSQFLSGLLITYAFAATDTVTLHVTDLKSKPYIDLTVQMLNYFGKSVINDNYQSFTIAPSNENQLSDIYINIEADYSAAANFVVAKAMKGGIEIEGLNPNSLQADKEIMNVVNDGNHAFDFDATDCPDLIPILAIYAGQCTGSSKLKGLERLIHKESNRIESTTAMLQQLGIGYSVDNDELTINDGAPFNSCTINSYNDHRIVMAAAIATLNATGDIIIADADAVNKSFPKFFDTLKAIGVDCQLVN